jgi:hypothetical protein
MGEIVLIAGLAVAAVLAVTGVLLLLIRALGFGFYSSARPARAGTMLKLIPSSVTSLDYAVFDESGLVIDFSARWSGDGEFFVADGKQYRLRRQTGFTKTTFVLELGDVVVAQATEPVLRGPLTIEYGHRKLRLRSFIPILSSNLELLDEDGELVGSFVREGIWGGPATAELPGSLATPLRLFIVWLAITVWQRMHDP